MKRLCFLGAVLCLAALGVAFRPYWNAAFGLLAQRTSPKKTVPERLTQFGPTARARLTPLFNKKKVSYPAKAVILVGIKDERRLEVYASNEAERFEFIRWYPILAASGTLGPKLKEGDRQVPEGIYPIESLNPNSRFHLSLRVGYPNAFDREQAKKDARTNLGGDIMIHGNSVSVGCLAVGDEAAEDLFVLAAAGLTNVTLLLTPVDFRQGKTVAASDSLPPWTASLYAHIQSHLKKLPRAE